MECRVSERAIRFAGRSRQCEGARKEKAMCVWGEIPGAEWRDDRWGKVEATKESERVEKQR
jgi:hypothetical protein